MPDGAGHESGNSFRLDSDVLRRLHASSLEDPAVIRRMLESLRDEGIGLTGRRTLRGDAESARIRRVTDSALVITSSYMVRQLGETIYFNFTLAGRSYFFSTVTLLLGPKGEPAEVSIPSILYVAERRDRPRRMAGPEGDAPRRVRLMGTPSGWTAEAEVDDYSPVGLNVQTTWDPTARIGDQVRVEYLDGALAGRKRWAEIRYAGPTKSRDGWLRLGLAVSEVQQGDPIVVDRRKSITRSSPLERAKRSLALMSAGAVAVSAKFAGRDRMQSRGAAELHLVEYRNDRGERLKGIIDSTGSTRGSTAVMIPPAWGRTKETLLPLAATIVESFRRAGESVVVLRFDGTRRRGESYKEPGFTAPGSEHLRFTFSDAIDDIITSARFLMEPDGVAASKVILVTFSAASIEGRRAILLDGGKLIRGWVSVVGTPDLQSGMRTVSGGVDYISGGEQGIKFGVQEIMGVATDVDLFLADALALRLPFLEDARRDMATIRIPVTWVHGANDAWLDLERVREVMSCGDTSRRRLIEVPTGHQLRSSREALDVFQLVASEVGEMALERSLKGSMPNLGVLDARRIAERQRLPKLSADVRAFWKEYLVGRNGMLGIELMNATRAFDELMQVQISGLQLESHTCVADVGAGTGAFPLALRDAPVGLAIDEIDYIPEGLERARDRLEGRPTAGVHLRFVECDLDNAKNRRDTFPPSRYDAALLSLVLSYLNDPVEVLRDIYRSLSPGGRIVVSSLRRDADISRLYLDGVNELRAGRARALFGVEGERKLEESVRSFLNDMARVLDLEEQGIFTFLDSDEIERMASDVGFVSLSSTLCFGNPPQAVVIVGKKPTSSP